MKRIKGAISTGILTLSFGIIAGVFTGTVWVMSSINSAIAPVQAQTNTNTADIAGMKSDISWIKQALNDNGVRPNRLFSSTSTP